MLPQNLWVPDCTHASCTACEAPFSFASRRHHCRACGGLYCSTCAPNVGPVRKCVVCVGHPAPSASPWESRCADGPWTSVVSDDAALLEHAGVTHSLGRFATRRLPGLFPCGGHVVVDFLRMEARSVLSGVVVGLRRCVAFPLPTSLRFVLRWMNDVASRAAEAQALLETKCENLIKGRDELAQRFVQQQQLNTAIVDKQLQLEERIKEQKRDSKKLRDENRQLLAASLKRASSPCSENSWTGKSKTNGSVNSENIAPSKLLPMFEQPSKGVFSQW